MGGNQCHFRSKLGEYCHFKCKFLRKSNRRSKIILAEEIFARLKYGIGNEAVECFYVCEVLTCV